MTAATAAQQAPPAPATTSQPRPQRPQTPMDPDRAQRLYVSADPKDHSTGTNFQRDIEAKQKIEERYAEVTKGVMEFTKVKYRSRVDDMEIPAYLFQPLTKRGAKGHAAMVWVHGGVHGDWGTSMLPFVQGGGRARLRGHHARLSRQHRLRRRRTTRRSTTAARRWTT